MQANVNLLLMVEEQDLMEMVTGVLIMALL